MLVRLLYASRAMTEVDDALLASILRRSRENNDTLGITGILCVQKQPGLFLQVLEGGRAEVNRLYAHILRDSRHYDVTLLDYQEVDQRLFGGWRMGSVDLAKVNRSIVLRFSHAAELDPYSMSARGALAMLEELASSAAIVSREGP
jgi:hypothetical protein